MGETLAVGTTARVDVMAIGASMGVVDANFIGVLGLGTHVGVGGPGVQVGIGGARVTSAGGLGIAQVRLTVGNLRPPLLDSPLVIFLKHWD